MESCMTISGVLPGKEETRRNRMLNLEINEYLSRVGIRKITELDRALVETYGPKEGEKHIEKLTELFDQSEERLVYGAGDTEYLHRQGELVDYLNQSLQMSLLAASFYDRVFFKRVMEYLLRYDSFWAGDIFDIGCGNGILTCFLALRHPDSFVTGLEISANAVLAARELAEKLQADNVSFVCLEESAGKLRARNGNPACPDMRQAKCDALFSCRTVHENVAWRALGEGPEASVVSAEEQERRHRQYAKELSILLKPEGYLISVERYEDDGAYAGLIRALEHFGICQVKGTHMQFACRNGDETAVFQATAFQKTGGNTAVR